MNKTLFRHPEIVVHLGKVFVPGINHEANDALRLRLFTAVTQRSGDERARRRPTEDPLFTQQLTHCCKTFPVVDLEHFRHQRHVGDFRNKILADAFDGPAACFVELA